jgi:coenzyme F420-reducing hydrogenase beta subunit
MINYITTKRKEDCCGCKACEQICAHHAISFHNDEEGFWYPSINEINCVQCGLCEKVCPMEEANMTLHSQGKAYAFQLSDKEQLLNSSSGGVFFAISSSVLSENGVVYGATFDGKTVKHKRADSLADIEELMGSKYVQSDIGNTYIQVKQDLKDGRKVFYTGTPCQVAGLKLFLRKEYENLLTADLVCHGTPSPKILADTISHIEDRLKARFKNYSFRDKRVGGWSCSSSSYVKGNKRTYLKYSKEMEAYFNAFISGHLMRMSCYQCPFARLERPGDITIADYWGVKELHPEFLNISKGMSLYISNSKKGGDLLMKLSANNFVHEVDLQQAAEKNHNLKAPTSYPKEREKSYLLFSTDYNGFLKKYYKGNIIKDSIKANLIYIIRNNEWLFNMVSKLTHVIKK